MSKDQRDYLLGAVEVRPWSPCLTHWDRVTHIYIRNLSIISSNNGLSPVRRQAIIWTNGWIFVIVRLGTKFSDILIEICTFSFTKMNFKMSSGKWWPFCLGLNVLTHSTHRSPLTRKYTTQPIHRRVRQRQGSHYGFWCQAITWTIVCFWQLVTWDAGKKEKC